MSTCLGNPFMTHHICWSRDTGNYKMQIYAGWKNKRCNIYIKHTCLNEARYFTFQNPFRTIVILLKYSNICSSISIGISCLDSRSSFGSFTQVYDSHMQDCGIAKSGQHGSNKLRKGPCMLNFCEYYLNYRILSQLNHANVSQVKSYILVF